MTDSVKNKVLTIPNLLSIYRLLTLIPVIYLFPDNSFRSKLIILILFISALISDILDGIIARKFNQISEIGKILDPIIDKIMTAVIGILLIIYRELPVWVMVFIISRDIIIFFCGIYIKYSRNILMTSLFIGKISALFIGFTGILFFVELTKIAYPVMYFTIFLLILSSFMYALKFYKLLKSES